MSQSVWKIMIDPAFQNCEKIFPGQQRKVRTIVDYFKENENVRKIIIFGSSITNRCHLRSDVDFYLELDKDVPTKVNDYWDFEYDKWTSYMVDDRMLEEIKRTGVVVYEK